MPASKLSVACARLLVERHRRFNIRRRHRATVGASREVGEDPLGAGGLVGCGRRLAHEESLAARGLADALDVVGTLDTHRLQPRQAADHVDFLAVTQRGLPDVLTTRRPLSPRIAHFVRTCRDEDLAGHARVDERLRLVHVLRLDLVILLATDFRGEDLFAVDGDDERVRRLVALDAGVALFHSTDEAPEQLVLGVGGEDVIDDRAAARAEWEPLDVHVLTELAADRILRRAGADVRIADCHGADALRRGQVALEQQWRSAQRGGDVVEAEVGTVARQQLGDVDIERQQIANGVGVLSAVQTMHDVRPGVLLPCQARSSELASQVVNPAYSASVGCGMPCGGIARTLSLRSTRSHVAACGSRFVEAGRFEVHRLIRRRRGAAVVARDAVLLDPRLVFRRLVDCGQRLR